MSSRYASAHMSPQGPGDGRPTAVQIVKDEQRDEDLVGKVILITGCSSGLGVETAKALFHTGATLYLTARDLGAARIALGDLVGQPTVHLLELDLSKLDSVRACAKNFVDREKSLNILITNAGVMATPEGRTVDGFETQFGINYIAHFLLVYLLKDILIASSSPSFHSRLVTLSSTVHRVGNVHLDNLTLEGEYIPWKAYAQSKTANIWTANLVERRYGSQGLHAVSVHPGNIDTKLSRYQAVEMDEPVSDEELRHHKSPEQGAATTVWGAVARELEGRGGLYLEDSQVVGPVNPYDNGRFSIGYAPWAFDEEGEEQLWTMTVKLLKLEDEAR